MIHFTPFYIGFILLVFHLPFALLSFFFAVNGYLYSPKKYASAKVGTGILWGLNTLLLMLLIYEQKYVYPGFVLWVIPSICCLVGRLRWKFPIFSWLLSMVYVVTIMLMVLGGIKNQLGFGPKDGVHLTYYTEDKKAIKSIKEYEFGRLNGTVELFYENGQLKTMLSYYLDTLEGPVKVYYENGQLKTIYQNNQNKIHGLYRSYHENGIIASQQLFEHGALSGIQQQYYPTGQLNSQFYYENGQKEGACLVYYNNGQLENTCHYKNGVGNYTSYYENGQLREKGLLNLDRREGLWENYHSNGVLKSTGYYKVVDEKRSVKDGLWKNYHINGQLELVGKYEVGVRKGEWTKYFDTGERSDGRNYDL